jgi:hypothetical protein
MISACSTHGREGYALIVLIERAVGSRKPRLMAVGIRCADHATPSTRKSWH